VKCQQKINISRELNKLETMQQKKKKKPRTAHYWSTDEIYECLSTCFGQNELVSVFTIRCALRHLNLESLLPASEQVFAKFESHNRKIVEARLNSNNNQAEAAGNDDKPFTLRHQRFQRRRTAAAVASPN
jgi:DNA-binding transcriptional regulator GbsR (MarR family)